MADTHQITHYRLFSYQCGVCRGRNVKEIAQQQALTQQCLWLTSSRLISQQSHSLQIKFMKYWVSQLLVWCAVIFAMRPRWELNLKVAAYVSFWEWISFQVNCCESVIHLKIQLCCAVNPQLAQSIPLKCSQRPTVLFQEKKTLSDSGLFMSLCHAICMADKVITCS